MLLPNLFPFGGRSNQKTAARADVWKSWLRRIRGWAVGGILSGGLLFGGELFAADFSITSLADTSDPGTLRHALEQAALDGTAIDTIAFHASLAGQSIELGSMLPIINKTSGTLHIVGLGADPVTIDGNNATRIFFVQSGSVVLENLALTGGAATGGSGGTAPYGGGGGGGMGAGGALFVNENAQVTVRNSTLTSNRATGGQGGGTDGNSGSGGGGGGGLHGDGGSATHDGGGGGGGLNGDGGGYSSTSFAGGGGGGAVLDGGTTLSTLVPGPGGGLQGGNGGISGNAGQDAQGAGGGGGGGGRDGAGGAGEDFGGSGGNGSDNTTAGIAGFGGGGGGAGWNGTASGQGGFGGGNGGAAQTGGVGGDGLGGAVFVREGGELILENVSINSNKAIEGDGGDGFTTTGADGDAQGDGLYVMENVDVVFRVIDGTEFIVQDGIAGEGSLRKNGLGTLNLNNATFQLDAGVTVDAGRLNVNSNVESNIAISGDGELGGSGTITGNVSNLGMLAPGNSIGTLNITGDYTHNKSADIEVEIDADGNTDKLNVSGTAFLNGGTVTVVAAPGNYSGAGPYTFLEAGLVDGTFDSITDDLAFFDAELGYTGTTAFFTLIANGSDYAAEARTYNQYQTAAYLDTHSGGGTGEYRQFLDHLNFMSGNQARQAFQEASGEIYGSVGQLQVQNTTQMYLMLSQQTGGMRGFGSSGGGGYAANPASSSDMQYGLATPNQTGNVQQVSYQESAQPVVLVRYAEPSHTAWRGWTSGYGIGGNAQSDGNAAGGNYGIGGTTFGAEKWVDYNHAIGLWGGYANVHHSTRGLGQSATVNSVQLGGYLRYEDEDQYYLLGGAGGIDDYSTSRFIDGGGLNLMAEGATTGGQGSAWLERGMIFRGRTREFRPFAALNYVHVVQDGFTETGAGTMNLNVGDVRTHALRGLLGGRASWTRQTSSGFAFRPELHAAWMHEFLDTETSVVTNITGAGGPGFTTRGLNYGRDWALVGGGFSLDLTHSLSFGAAYDIQANHRQALHMGSGNLQYRW